MEKKVSKDEMRKLPYIIAVDFDGTLVEDKFPEIGEIRTTVWKELTERMKVYGTRVILWTSRDHDNLKAAVQFCAEHGLHFDAINANLDEVQVLFNNDTRKVYADEYWDDKARSRFCVD